MYRKSESRPGSSTEGRSRYTPLSIASTLPLHQSLASDYHLRAQFMASATLSRQGRFAFRQVVVIAHKVRQGMVVRLPASPPLCRWQPSQLNRFEHGWDRSRPRKEK